MKFAYDNERNLMTQNISSPNNNAEEKTHTINITTGKKIRPIIIGESGRGGKYINGKKIY